MAWPLSMVSRTCMRAVAWPGATCSIWMPRWRDARSASYIAAAARSARAWGSSGTRPPGARPMPVQDRDCPGLRQTGTFRFRWAGAAGVGGWEGGGRGQRRGVTGEGCGMALRDIEFVLLDEERVKAGV